MHFKVFQSNKHLLESEVPPTLLQGGSYVQWLPLDISYEKARQLLRNVCPEIHKKECKRVFLATATTRDQIESDIAYPDAEMKTGDLNFATALPNSTKSASELDFQTTKAKGTRHSVQGPG